MPTKTKGGRNSAGSEKGKKVSGPLIEGRVSIGQVEKAIVALQKHREKSKQAAASSASELPLEGTEGIDGEGSRVDRSEVIWMQLTVKRLNQNAPVKAVRIPLPHAVWPKSSSICLLTADPQRQYKDLMVEEKLTQVKRVVGVTKLKGKFKPFEVRRQLMNNHDVFLADDRIIPMLPKLLGKKWLEDRKSPIPVKLTKTKDGRLTKEINGALASTYFYRNKGTCSSIRLGTLSHLSAEEMTENLVASLPVIVAKHVKGGWENVQSIDIKTGSSAALPVWNSKLDERWIGMPGLKEGSDAESSAEEDEEENNDAAPSTKKTKTAKFSSPAAKNDEKAETPSKKSRSSISADKIGASAIKKSNKKTTA